MIQYNNTPITAAAATVAYWIWKKINKVLFPWPDTAYLSGPRIPIAVVYLLHAAGEDARARARLVSVRPPGSDRLIIYMHRRRHRCRSPEGHLPRGKNAFSSRLWLSFCSFYIIHSLTLSLSLSSTLSTQYNTINYR